MITDDRKERPYDRMASWYLASLGGLDDAQSYFAPLCRVVGQYISSGRILDVGCGVGLSSIALRENGYDVVGIDVSCTSIQQAEELWHDQTGDGLRFQTVDVQELPPELGLFDAVVATNNLLAHLAPGDERRNAVAAMAARLKPGGYLVLPQYDMLEPDIQPPVEAPRIPKVCALKGKKFIYFRRDVWNGNEQEPPQELKLHRIDEDGAMDVVRIPLWPVTRSEILDLMETEGLSDPQWKEPVETGYPPPICVVRKPTQEEGLHLGRHWHPLLLRPADLKPNPYEELPAHRGNGMVQIKEDGNRTVLTRRRQVTLVMFSGGIDSVYALARLLRESDDVIIAHHLNLVNLERRHLAERDACRKLVSYLRRTERDFKYSESTVDRRRLSGFGMDDVTVAFEAGAVAKSYAHAASGTIDRWTTGTCLEEELEDMSAGEEGDSEQLGHMLSCTAAAAFPVPPPRYFQLPIIPKRAQMDFMGKTLVELCWTCRQPVARDHGGFDECGTCKTCELMSLIRRGERTIPE